jgi:UDP-2,3-diacylglucosamine pyrophosphatase LpxH
MTLHAEILDLFSREAKAVRLVASIRDARLAFASPQDARIFLPDMHVVSAATRAKYSYGVNDTGLLARVLQGIAAMKAVGGRTIAVYQVGDFLDLWREEPVSSARADAASRIVVDHATLMNALFDERLKARFLLGNHDVDLAWWSNFVAWERRYFLPPRGAMRASGMALHGDVFDWVEFLPDAFNRFFVYYFSPLSGAADHDLKHVKAKIEQENARHDFSTQIAGTAALGTLGALDAATSSHNLSEHGFLDKARATAKKMSQAAGLDLRFMVIGHTHQARIAVRDDAQGFFVLVDCGAWIENGRDATGRVFPNQQLAVLSENEFRIYQLDS